MVAIVKSNSDCVLYITKPLESYEYVQGVRTVLALCGLGVNGGGCVGGGGYNVL